MAILLAVSAAVGWGAADFFGGASRRATPVFVIVAIGELLGLVALVPVLVAHGIAPPDSPRLWLACIAGIGVTLELGLIYLALSHGEAFITAPVGALGAAVAVTAGLIGGDPLDVMVATGLVCALLGGGLGACTSGSNSRGRSALRSAAMSAGAAAGVATMLTCFHAAGRVDPYWATAAEHASTGVSAGLIALIGSGSQLRHRLPRLGQVPPLALVALGGVGGDLAYAAASKHAPLSIVSAISSLYPITTIALGVLIQRHRPGRVQSIGIILALAGAALLGAASQ